jgi:hypothetical protein
MTCGMEMHDSSLLEVTYDRDGKGFVLFHAYVYQSKGQVFRDAQRSGWQDVRFDFEGMRIEGEIGELKAAAYNGELWIDGKNENGIIFLPANHDGEICLEMTLAGDARTLKIHASKVTSSFVSEFEVEAYWDDTGERTHAGAA